MSLRLNSVIPVKSLLCDFNGQSIPENVNSNYKPQKMELYYALYEGRERFDKIRDKILDKRDIEFTVNGSKIRAKRVAMARYRPHVSGLVDWVLSNVISSKLKLEATGDNEDYWNGLNEDFDGTGRSILNVLRDILLDGCLHNRGYLSIYFPEGGEGSVAAMKAAGALDAKFCRLPACDVDDWSFDDEKNLEWVRTHLVEQTRDVDFGGPNTENHYWCYYAVDATWEFKATRPIVNNIPKPWLKSDIANGAEESPIINGVLPIVPLMVPPGGWIMERLADAAISLWNKESQGDYLEFISCFPTPVLKTNKNVKEVFNAAEYCIILKPGDDFLYASPQTTIYTSMRSNIQEERKALFSLLQATALDAPNRPQAARQSGTALALEKESIDGLLDALGSTIYDMVMGALNRVKEVRQDNTEFVLHGLREAEDTSQAKIVEEEPQEPDPNDSTGNPASLESVAQPGPKPAAKPA